MAVYYDGYQGYKLKDKYEHLRAFAILLITNKQDTFVQAYSFCTRGKTSKTGLGVWKYVSKKYKYRTDYK